MNSYTSFIAYLITFLKKDKQNISNFYLITYFFSKSFWTYIYKKSKRDK